MKKILSAVLAAAMVLSMGVMAFAADVNFGSGTGANDKPIGTDADQRVSFNEVSIVRGGKVVKTLADNVAYDELQGEDALYFPVKYDSDLVNTAAPSDWQIKINNADYVDGADFYRSDAAATDFPANGGTALVNDQLYVKVSLTDFSDFEDGNVNFYFYIYDKSTRQASERVKVKYSMEDYKATLKEVDLDWVITVAGPRAYKYDSKAKAKNATFDFNGVAFAEVKLFPGETYKVNVNTKYDKDIARLYPEADFEFVELFGDFDKAADVVLPASKDNKFIYEVVDGDLVAVDAEYVKGHKFDSGEKVNGYLFTTNELGKYAISDVELDLEDEDIDLDDDTTSAPVEDNKVNPPMGANDFVGAAVALAVVSVAAAGALALKK